MSTRCPTGVLAGCKAAVLCMLLGLCALCAPSRAQAADAVYDVDVTLTNTFPKDYDNLPVVIQIFRVFGRGVDYTKFNRDGFHIYDDKGTELAYTYRVIPPDFSMANDELVLTLPKFAKGAKLNLRFTNTPEKSAKAVKFEIDALLANPNNLVPNGGFEKGVEGWEGGKLAAAGAHSGKNALLLEVPGGGGAASLKCTKTFPIAKGQNYYFGTWMKCENVTRRTWRYSQPWAQALISGRLTFSGDPFNFPEFADGTHLIRLMDDRDWYCYENNALSTLCVPQPTINGADSTLTLALNQENMPYLDANKPARIWIDDVLLFEQPQIDVSADRIKKKGAPDGFFLYRRAPTCLDQCSFALPHLDAPRVYEKIDKLNDTAALGERKTVMVGVNTAAPIQGLCLEVSDLKGPNGAVLGEAAREIEFNYTPVQNWKFNAESLEGWVIDGNAPRNIDRPGFIDYLIGFKIPTDAAPGKYAGTVKIKGGGKDLGTLPLELEVVNIQLKPITDKFAGLIYNAGQNTTNYRNSVGWDKDNGAVQANRDANFYKYYARCNFSYMMMFCQFLPWKGESPDVDLGALVAQMKEMRDVAGCTAGVGLYADCSLDKQGNNGGPEGGRGLWKRCGGNADIYRAKVKEMDAAIKKEGLPPLVYMIWDEPRFCDPVKFGILKDLGSQTTSDINYRECCEQLQKGLFTAASVDGPGADYGPMFRKFATKCGGRIGFDSFAAPFCNRYQTGFMLANGAATASFWHVSFYMGFHNKHQAFVRAQTMVGIGEGMIDLRYFETLQETIENAKKKNVAKTEVAAAEKYLQTVMGFCTDDFHFMSEIETFTYNGGPERWGDDWFYDRWRGEMRNHILAIQKAGGLGVTAAPAGVQPVGAKR